MNESNDPSPLQNPLNVARQQWDNAAPGFDDEPDHGLRDPAIRQAWLERLRGWLPQPPAHLLDIGCGTASLSLLAASLGLRVSAADLSPAMITQARAKSTAAGLEVAYAVMDAAAPGLSSASVDAILCRHLLWALPEPGRVLAQWADMLRPSGRLILIEGFWYTGAGLRASQVRALLPPKLKILQTENLSPLRELWGRTVDDERYAVLAVNAANA